MVSFTLVYEQDEEYGGLGFRIEGSKKIAGAYNMATEGLLIAHDILEHSKIEDIGTIGDELKALGGVWFVRGQLSDMRRDGIGSMYTPHQNVASDVVNMGRSIVLGHTKYYAKVPRVQPNKCIVINDLLDIIAEARKDLPGELEVEEYTKAALDKYLDDTLKFMVYGYNKAKERYRRIGGRYRANKLFWDITEEVDTALKQAEYEGQRFKLKINYSKCEATCEELYEYWEDAA